MADISAASLESYGRVYPLLIRLHALREVERVRDRVTVLEVLRVKVGDADAERDWVSEGLRG